MVADEIEAVRDNALRDSIGVANQFVQERRPRGAVVLLRGVAEIPGECITIVQSVQVLEDTKSRACVSRNIDNADLLPSGDPSPPVFANLVGKRNLSSGQKQDAPGRCGPT